MKPLRSFYAKLSLIFLLLILALGASSLLIAFTAAERLFDEVEQLLNREYAASIADELQPLVADEFSVERVQNAIHYMMVLNPMVEIYLVDEQGLIRAYFTHPEESLAREKIDTTPLETFITKDGQVPVLGDDPRTPSLKKPFSAAPLRMGADPGYVYVILRGGQYDRTFEMLRNSYYLRSGLITFIIAVLFTLLLGLLLFSFLTRRLRRLSTAVMAFEQGQYSYRTEIRGQDEIGALGRGFNEMAASIEAGIEKLTSVEQQRRNLITNISHDLRSPLTSISGYLETIILRDAKLKNEERREYIQASLRNVSSLRKLVEELFELARFETNQVTPLLERFQLAELVQDTVQKLKARAHEKGISVDVDQPGEAILMVGDIGMIERLLTNILENALTYTPSGGSVHINLDTSSDTARISIEDTGLGIQEDDLPHIFERFYRAGRSRNRNTPGSGLGLAIAREITELHGGRIAAESPSGKGAVIRIILPLDAGK